MTGSWGSVGFAGLARWTLASAGQQSSQPGRRAAIPCMEGELLSKSDVRGDVGGGDIGGVWVMSGGLAGARRWV